MSQASNVNLVDLVSERIKKSPLGDIIKDEDLYDIVKQGIERAFFEPRVVKDGYHTRTLSPLIEETVKDALGDHMKPMIAKWIVENHEKLDAMMQKVMEGNVVSLADRIMQTKVADFMRPAMSDYQTAMNEAREKLGLPPIYY